MALPIEMALPERRASWHRGLTPVPLQPQSATQTISFPSTLEKGIYKTTRYGLGAFLLLGNTVTIGDGQPLSNMTGQFPWCQWADLSVPGASLRISVKVGRVG